MASAENAKGRNHGRLQYEETEEGKRSRLGVFTGYFANIYMHYVLVWWFKGKEYSQISKDSVDWWYMPMISYAVFQYKAEAEQFYRRLSKRMENFGLELEMSKSRLIEFGRYAEETGKCRGKGETRNLYVSGIDSLLLP